MPTGKSSFYKMTTSIDIDNNDEENDDDDEQAPLNSQPLDERILDIIRNTKQDEHDGHRTIRPALLANSLGLSVEEATRELCGLLAAVGGGEDGASFVFERVDMPGEDDTAKSPSSFGATTTMVFNFPHDFDKRAKRYRRNSDMKQRVQTFAVGLIKAVKVFTAFGLIISLAVLIIAGICLLVAAVIALARGGHGNGGGGHRNHPLMHRLRYLFFQLRQILWLYAICGSNGQNGDPFMREVAGDLAFMMSMFCGNPMHPFFWFRVGGMRQRWARVRRTRGWGNTDGSNMDGIAMMRRGTWGDDNHDDGNSALHNQRSSSSFNSEQQQRGLLSIAVEFLFGPSDNSTSSSTGTSRNLPSTKELQKWKYRVSVIITLSTSSSEGSGISLRELLPYVDLPPASAEDPAAIRETLKIVSYFNGRPVAASGSEPNSGIIDARFCFPQIIAEMDCQKLLSMGSSEFAPPTFESESNISSILYKEEVNDFGSSDNASNDMASEYLYEQPFVLTELSRQQFGQCVMLGLLNFVGIIWIHSALMLQLPLSTSSSRSKPLLAFASMLVLKMFKILSFYSKVFLLLPLCRLVIVLIRNYLVERRNKRRLNFVRAEL